MSEFPGIGDIVEAAHHNCRNNREELSHSVNCGCFYCLSIFKPEDIREWADGGLTALCPSCNVDAVIGNASGYPIDGKFLSEMHSRWFED